MLIRYEKIFFSIEKLVGRMDFFFLYILTCLSSILIVNISGVSNLSSFSVEH